MTVSDGASGSGPDELDYLFSVAYDELRRLALAVKERDGSQTLNPTALVNEAWLRLRGARRLRVESRLHFKRIAARAMRQILVEAARRRCTKKRGGDLTVAKISLEDLQDHELAISPDFDQILAFEEALVELESLHPRQAQIVEGRFYGGLEFPELTETLAVSEATIMREWRMARAWMAHRLRTGPGEIPLEP